MPLLQNFDAEFCNLTGTLPASLPSLLPGLQLFQMGSNRLSGKSYP